MIFLSLPYSLKRLPTIIVVSILFLLSSWNSVAQHDLTVNGAYSIPVGSVLEVNNLVLNSNAVLNIEGTLIVRGNLSMANNSPEFKMGNNARVIVYGNFIAANKIQISVTSYLIIYGDFIKDGSSNQGDLTISNGSIYIFGDVDPDWTDLQNCSSYGGNTTNEQSTCDYGKLEEYEKNFDSLPPDLQQNLRCFPLSNISNKNVCTGNATEFSVNAVPNVTYQWQVKTQTNSNWNNTGINSRILNIPTTTVAMSGNQYRVVLKPTNTTSACKIAISNTATLTVNRSIEAIGSINGPTEVCSETGNLTYSLSNIEGAQSFVWTFPSGWIILNGGNTNVITVQAGAGASSGIIRATVNGTCNSRSTTLVVRVQSPGIWTGTAGTNWNNTANWSCNSLPTLNRNVIIPSGLSNYPIVSTGEALSRNLTIETGAQVTVNNNWLRITGNLNNNGSLNTGNGNISFQGSSEQTIPPGAFTGNRILNLRINNSAGVTSQATIEIINSLNVASGTFATGNDLTLISNPSGTAFIDGSGGGQVTGTVKMQRYLNNGFGYKYFSSPFSNSTVGNFSGFMDLSDGTTSFPHFYEYREGRKDSENNDLTGWQAYIEPGNNLKIAQGYALNISASTTPVNVEISGEVNNGPKNILLEHNNGLYTKGFNLVGNPYPSPIDWSLMVPTLNGIDNAIYFFNAGTDDRYTGTYSSYVNGVSTGVNTTIIPSMQGFFVRVSEPADEVYPATATLSFTNAVRTGNQTSQDFYKAKNPRVKPQIKLTAGFTGEQTSDATVIYFDPGATSEFEKDLDALKLLNTAVEVPSLYCLTKNREKLSISAVSAAETQEIPLGITAEKTGKMFIRLANVENIFPSAFIYLKDLKNKVMHDFSEEPVYSYTSQKGEINDRFSLIVTSEKLSENELRTSLEYFSVHAASGEILVKLNLSENTSGNVILSSISGQVLQNRSGKEKEEIKFSGITAPGVYLVSLELAKERFTKKILIKK